MRDPSLHIKKSDFVKVLKELGLTIPDDKMKTLFELSKKDKIYRNIITSSNRIEKKVKSITKSDIGDCELFSQLLTLKRKQLKHRGELTILPTSRDWPIIKKLVEEANFFIEEFEFDKRDGYIEFINILISQTNKFSISRLQLNAMKVVPVYKNIKTIKEDKYPDITAKLHLMFCTKIFQKTGLDIHFQHIPDKYIHFVELSEILVNRNIPPKIYIDAQFQLLDWVSGVPEPAYLSSEKAMLKFNKFCFENDIKINNVRSEKKVNNLMKLRDI